MQADLARGSVLTRVLGFSLPLAVGMASQAAFNLVDLLLVGRLGEDAVAAVHLGGTINFLPMILGNGISVGIVALVGSEVGARRFPAARRVANLGLVCMCVTSALLGIGCYLAATPLVEAEAARGASLVEGVRYLEVMSLGTFTMYLLLHVTGVLRAIGNATWPVVLLVAANALNLLLDIVLIFGVESWGIPAYGVLGAAWATVLARGLGGVAGLLLLMRPKSRLRPGLRLPDGLLAVLGRVVAIGLPQTMQMLVRAALVVTITRFAGEIAGPAGHAALGVTIRLDAFLLFAGIGWASGATAMVAQCLGRGLHARCHEVAKTTCGLAALLALVVGLSYAFFARSLVAFFVPEAGAQVLALGADYLGAMAFGHPAAAATLVLAGSMNGARLSVLPLILDGLVLGLVLQSLLWLWPPQGGPASLRHAWILVVVANWLLLGLYLWLMRKAAWLPAARRG